MTREKMTLEYICTRLGEEDPHFNGAVTPPIFETSLHVFDKTEDLINYNAYDEKNRFIYGRVDNPTVKLLETKLAAIEEADGAVCFASGMAAITSAMLFALKPGDHLVCISNAYGPAKTFIDGNLARMNISVTYVDGRDPQDFEKAILPNTRAFYLESPSSLVLAVTDLMEVAKIAKANNIITMIDNTYCAGVYQKPLNLGIDIAMHTISKYYGGHSDVIGGALMANAEIIKKIRDQGRELYGGILGPFEAWLVIRSLRTLPIRLKASSENAMAMAEMLDSHPRIRRVNYPMLPSFPQKDIVNRQMTGACGLLSFEPDMSLEDTLAFTNRLKLFRKGVSWGGFESLCVMPMYKSTDQEAADRDTSRNLVRIYCGLEGKDDLLDDVKAALEQV